MATFRTAVGADGSPFISRHILHAVFMRYISSTGEAVLLSAFHSFWEREVVALWRGVSCLISYCWQKTSRTFLCLFCQVPFVLSALFLGAKIGPVILLQCKHQYTRSIVETQVNSANTGQLCKHRSIVQTQVHLQSEKFH